ncbi:MAG TPA: histidinol dehydrogenase [Rhodothermales bacterium]
MDVVKYPDRRTWTALSRRPTESVSASVSGQAQSILDLVRKQGDAAVRQLTHDLDGLTVENFRVSLDSLQEAAAALSPELVDAIQTAIRNVRTFHEAQLREERAVETQPGVVCWRRSTPIASVGLYVPGGTAPLFSSAIMLAVPALVAGCRDIVLCSPPVRGGGVHPVIAGTAHLLGLTKVFAVGGAQAIAAMAYGTETVPRVDKIFGPGNQWVTAAKQLVGSEGVAIDLPAGPTELLIIADDSVPVSFVAADVLAQAEHGVDSQVVVVTWSAQIARDLKPEISRQLAGLPRKSTAGESLGHSHLVLLESVDEAVEFSNHYAPEHLILACRDAETIADKIVAAGSVFIGAFTPEAAGDYASGTNHTLPTGGFARTRSGVSVESFMKFITFQQISRSGLESLGPVVQVMAEAEQLSGHARSVGIRLDHITENGE